MNSEQSPATNGNSGTDAVRTKKQNPKLEEIKATAGTALAFLAMLESLCLRNRYDFKEQGMIKRAILGAFYDMAINIINENK